MAGNTTQVAHIGLAVQSIDEALRFYSDVLGMTPSSPEEADGAKIVSLSFAGVEVELLEPQSPDGPVAKFIGKRGPGIHHICFRVPDLESTLQACRKQGYRLIDQTPRMGSGGHRIAFVHPEATAGVLVELTE